MADGAASRRLGVRVRGIVQGVGFRPFVYRLAQELELAGAVRNDGDGVWIEIEGEAVDAFVARLEHEAPPLALIDTISSAPLAARGGRGFEIERSAPGAMSSAAIPPDAGVCARCVEEMFDPADRRFGYPFIACCDCGPRFTMTRALPYDRAQTAMASFALCEPCAAEYGDPTTRRFHAEPTACAACGPRYSATPQEIHGWLSAGDIVAVKGVGGYHLMVDARNAEAVSRLRQRKERGGKPFALLAANVASVCTIADVDECAERELVSPRRPIVLMRARGEMIPEIAPGLDQVGVALPSTPLQWLLFWEAAGRPAGGAWRKAEVEALYVCTSANRGGEPLITNDREAIERLAGIADRFVSHDREIVVRADDPVVRIIAGAPLVLRRGRGQTPTPIKLPRAIPSTVGFGAHLKAAVCVTRGDEAYLSQHVGDLDDPETIRFYRETIARLVDILGVRPQRAACDLHPDFFSTRMAEESGLPLVRVQHHHAHAAACLAENCVSGPALALAMDGYGLGPSGEAWGGELLHVDATGMRRLGGLREVTAPGGDRAAREPWRLGLACLWELGRSDLIEARYGNEPLAQVMLRTLSTGAASRTSSCGRLFDAAASLLGLCERQSYEAEAAMLLEAQAGALRSEEAVFARCDGLVFDWRPLLASLLDRPVTEAAARFHDGLAAGLAEIASAAAAQTGLQRVALTGGCFANSRLAERVARELRRRGLTPLMHRAAPPGDGGLALGQAWIAGTREEL
jgi:hydrogenase maturation protein HypF